MNKRILSGCLCLIFLFSVISKAEEWRGIKPLHSTRADVERLLGQPTERYGLSYYVLENQRVSVHYSDGECSSPSDWSVPKDTVVSINISPVGGTLSLADLHLDNSKFKINKSLFEEKEYRNDDDGIVYIVEVNKFILEIYFNPSVKDSHFSCSANAPELTIDELHAIKPLYSTRPDVEKLIGKPVKPNGTFYILKDASVEITYSDGVCNGADDWNVPKNTVISVKIIPGNLMTFSQLVVENTKFEKLFDAILHGFLYRNEEDGITYEVDYGTHIPNTIDAVNFHPRPKDISLKCSANKK
ncbi:MAG: hypothetical protein ACR2L1_00885 [Pyrinomonadaceae bacterium]